MGTKGQERAQRKSEMRRYANAYKCIQKYAKAYICNAKRCYNDNVNEYDNDIDNVNVNVNEYDNVNDNEYVNENVYDNENEQLFRMWKTP